MLDYNTLYEYLRKEKYGDQLQALPKNFTEEVSLFLRERKSNLGESSDLFSDDLLRSKKQFENALSIFRELMRLRKKKILNLVFVASETGIMKRDFGTMLSFEQALFERLVLATEDADKELHASLNGPRAVVSDHKMVLIKQPINEIVDMSGSIIGPFEQGALVNLDSRVADILVADQKAIVVDS